MRELGRLPRDEARNDVGDEARAVLVAAEEIERTQDQPRDPRLVREPRHELVGVRLVARVRRARTRRRVLGEPVAGREQPRAARVHEPSARDAFEGGEDRAQRQLGIRGIDAAVRLAVERDVHDRLRTVRPQACRGVGRGEVDLRDRTGGDGCESVGRAAGAEHRDDLHAIGDERADDSRAQEPAGSGDEDAHVSRQRYGIRSSPGSRRSSSSGSLGSLAQLASIDCGSPSPWKPCQTRGGIATSE